MAVQVRRVVTGHDAKGRAVVKIDEVSKNIVSSRPGQTACVVWTTESFPVNNTGDADEGTEEGRHDTEERNGLSRRRVCARRGTIHNWVNRGTQPCVMAFILIDARPVEVDGKVLNAVG
jgi:hypothetical protein